MSPQLYTNRGKIKAASLKEDSIPDIARAGSLASALQKLLRDGRFDVINAVFNNIFPKNCANEFTSAIREKREGSIKFKVLENGEFQVNEVSFPKDIK
jgi:hypothetical protein